MRDADVLAHINELVKEEHDLLSRSEEEGGLKADERARLDDLSVQLDQCWDLLRQRRALREYGHDPDEARTRDPKIVEKYLQ
jgi:hypothetical protein